MQDTIYLWVAGSQYMLIPDTDQGKLEQKLAAAARDGGRFVSIPSLAPTALRLFVSPGLPVGVETVTHEPVVATTTEGQDWLEEYDHDLF